MMIRHCSNNMIARTPTRTVQQHVVMTLLLLIVMVFIIPTKPPVVVNAFATQSRTNTIISVQPRFYFSLQRTVTSGTATSGIDVTKNNNFIGYTQRYAQKKSKNNKDDNDTDDDLTTTSIDNESNENEHRTIFIRQISKTLQRTSWISWWSQVILTVISSIILLFAKSISPITMNINNRNSFILSSIGILISSISILWTWGNGTRLSKRLYNRIPISSNTIVTTMIHRAITIGIIINCIGLLCNLLAAQQIIGLFAIKVFTSSSTTSIVRSASTAIGGGYYDTNILQPLDILIIQANTNVLLSQYISLIALLSLIPRILYKLYDYNNNNDCTSSSDSTITKT
jgi:hypothetical protein